MVYSLFLLCMIAVWCLCNYVQKILNNNFCCKGVIFLVRRKTICSGMLRQAQEIIEHRQEECTEEMLQQSFVRPRLHNFFEVGRKLPQNWTKKKKGMKATQKPLECIKLIVMLSGVHEQVMAVPD
uniref:Uncharacterized protein n=1 Tax=Sphaerodactylus townsendi TaxID=933632 RepID=A0ACB8EJE9_9SAUR